jgi:hypothetical protein
MEKSENRFNLNDLILRDQLQWASQEIILRKINEAGFIQVELESSDDYSYFYITKEQAKMVIQFLKLQIGED